MPSFYKKLVVGALYDFRDLFKTPFGTTFSCDKRVLGALLSSMTRPAGSDPAFPETIVITVPFGPNGLKK